jgi:hypothetical protein
MGFTPGAYALLSTFDDGSKGCTDNVCKPAQRHMPRHARTLLIALALILPGQFANGTERAALDEAVRIAKLRLRIEAELLPLVRKADEPLRAELEKIIRIGAERLSASFDEWARVENATADDRARARHQARLQTFLVDMLGSVLLALDDATVERTLRLASRQTAATCVASDAPLPPFHEDILDEVDTLQGLPAEERSVRLTSWMALAGRIGRTEPARQRPLQRASVTIASAALEAPPTARLPASLLQALRDAPWPDITELDEHQFCVLEGWWAEQLLARPPGLARKADIDAYLFMVVDDLVQILPAEVRSLEVEPVNGIAYPAVATFHEIEGETQVRVGVDAEGRAVEVLITERNVRVPALHGRQSVVFDGVFDAGSIEIARNRDYSVLPPPMRSVDGSPSRRSATFTIMWKLAS